MRSKNKWSWVTRGPEPRINVLAKASNNLPYPTDRSVFHTAHLLVLTHNSLDFLAFYHLHFPVLCLLSLYQRNKRALLGTLLFPLCCPVHFSSLCLSLGFKGLRADVLLLIRARLLHSLLPETVIALTVWESW
jgi:hypothetical protein